MRLPAVVAALSLALLAAGSAAAAPDIRLYALDCGRLAMTNADAYADDGAYGGQAREMVTPCYLIRHPKGDLLWDTGLPQALADRPPARGPEVATVPRKLTDQLGELGLTSHFDHIGNAALFTRAIWIVDAEERAHAFRAAARADAAEFSAYAPLEKAKTVLIEGDAPYDVFGDGSVSIIQAPGHTPGHTVLMVRLAQAGPVLLTGDMWHFAESRAARRVPRFNFDRTRTLASMAKVEALARDTGARVVLQHVPADFEALPKFPQPLR
jgi:glyoxylase-like metal-dependent hydrolase (beta-lactamase superfamily II)